MKLAKIINNPGLISGITILLLLSSYIFILLYNNISLTGSEVSAGAKFFLFLTLIFLFLFLASFVLLALNIARITDIREVFDNPAKVSTISAIVLLCSYLSSVMSTYASSSFGELAPITRIFFYLALTFFVFFIIGFLAMLVSFSNRFLYSRKL